MHAEKRRAGGYNVHVNEMPTIGISNSFDIEQIFFYFLREGDVCDGLGGSSYQVYRYGLYCCSTFKPMTVSHTLGR